MDIMIIGFLFILAIFSKYIYWKHVNREMNYRHFLVDAGYLIFASGYIPFVFFVINYFDQNFSYQTAHSSFVSVIPFVGQFIIMLCFVFPIFVSYLYGYIYRKYFRQINHYFALQIFICYLVIPLLALMGIILSMYFVGIIR